MINNEFIAASSCDPADIGLSWTLAETKVLTRCLISTASHLAGKGQVEAADAMMQAARTLYPNNFIACSHAFVLIRAGCFTKAIECVGDLSMPEALTARAICTWAMGNPGYQVLVHEVMKSGHPDAMACAISLMPELGNSDTEENLNSKSTFPRGIRG